MSSSISVPSSVVPAPTVVPTIASAAESNCECLRVRQVAAKLGVSNEHVLRLLRSGKLPGFRIGRVWAVRKADLSRHLDSLLAASAQA